MNQETLQAFLELYTVIIYHPFGYCVGKLKVLENENLYINSDTFGFEFSQNSILSWDYNTNSINVGVTDITRR